MTPFVRKKTLQKQPKTDNFDYQVSLSSPPPDSPPYSYLNHARQEQASPSPLPGIWTDVQCDVRTEASDSEAADTIFALQAEREELELAEVSKQQFKAAGVGETVPRYFFF